MQEFLADGAVLRAGWMKTLTRRRFQGASGLLRRRPDMDGKEIKALDVTELSILPVRDTVLFPYALLSLTVGREGSLKLLGDLKEDMLLGVGAQRDGRQDDPQPIDLHRVGTAARVHKMIRLPNQSVLIFVEGIQRIAIEQALQQAPYCGAR